MIIYLRTSRTGSSNFVIFTRGHNIQHTDNTMPLESPFNKKILVRDKENTFFTNVRNPYTRAISMYKHQKNGHWGSNKAHRDEIKTFEKFLDINFKKVKEWRYHTYSHVCPISDYLGDYVKKLDYIFKLETLDKDIENFCKQEKLKHKFNDRFVFKQSISDEDKDKYLTESNMKIIYDKYKIDFENFNYEKSF